MFRCNLRSLITALSLTVVSPISFAEPESNGLVAIWKGDIVDTPSNGFRGTGFHIGKGYVVTAKHVLQNIGDEWFGVVASKNAIGNKVKVASDPKCFREADICIFQLDHTDSSVRDGQLSMPYGITCELPRPWPELTMTGFSGESNGPKHYGSIQIRAKSGEFQAPGNGPVYSKMLQTSAQTSPGTSGSPVVIVGSRNAVGVHVAFSDETKDQVVFPFYLLEEPIQFEGTKVFHPEECALGAYTLEETVVTSQICSHDQAHAVIIGNFRPPAGMTNPSDRVKEVLDFNINTKLQEAEFLGDERLAFIPCADVRPSGVSLGKQMTRNLNAHALVYGDIGTDDQNSYTVSTIIDDAYDMHPISYRSLNESVDLIFPAHASMNSATYSAILGAVAAGFAHAENCPFAIAIIDIIEEMAIGETANVEPLIFQSLLDELKLNCTKSLAHNDLLLE